MKKLVSLAAAALLCAGALLCTACSGSANTAANTDESTESATPAAVRIGTLATEDILPMWVAEDEGLFTQAGLDATVEVFQSATELIAAVNAGDVDLAMTDEMVTASIYASGTDVQVEWVTLGTDASQGRFGIMTADKSITSLKDLAGVPIGVGSNTVLEYVMDRLMEQAGVADSDIVTEELQKLPVRYQAMASGQVKAAALPASLLALGEANGFSVVADDTQGANLSQSVMIARSAFLETPEGTAAVQACKDVWNKAVEKINAAPESYRALLASKANLSDQIAQTYQVSTYPTCQLPEQAMVDDVLSWMQDKGYLAKGITYNAADGTFQGR